MSGATNAVFNRVYAQQSASRQVFKDDEIISPGTVTALIAAGRGDGNQAIPMLETVINASAPGQPQTSLAIDALAASLIRRGDLLGAEGALLRAGERQTLYPFAGSRGYIWLRLRAMLLGLEQQLGHRERAAEIQRELRELLVAADPDFALLRELN